MPLITLRTSTLLPEPTIDALAEGLSLLSERVLRKDITVTVVRFEGPDQLDKWYMGGRRHTGDEALVTLSVVVTKGTNTEDEKAAWIAEARNLLANHIGRCISPSYISILELDGTNWGYDGLTQRQRQTTIR